VDEVKRARWYRDNPTETGFYPPDNPGI